MANRRSRVTIDHDDIRRWAEARKGRPARVKGTGGRGDLGMIRLDFPGYAGANGLEPVGWDAWFKKFDDSNLALVLEETTARGQRSNFNKLIGRESVDLRTGALIQAPRRRRKQATRAGVGVRRKAAAVRVTRKAGKVTARKTKRRPVRAGTTRRKTAPSRRKTARAGLKTTGRRAMGRTRQRKTTRRTTRRSRPSTRR